MKKHQDSLALRASVLAVRGALIALAMVPAAYAEEAAADHLTKAASHVELGMTYVDKGSYKFGEYNGLQDKGLTVDAGFDLRGGSAYDSTGTTRYRLSGKDLGTDNRNLSADFAEQGKFRINFGYDELRRNSSDSYMSPYQGLGSSHLSLPPGWTTPMQLNFPSGAQTAYSTATNLRTLSPAFVANDTIFNGAAAGVPVAKPATALQQQQMNAIATADIGMFHNFDVYTTRKKYDAGFGVTLTNQWDVKASVRRENREGTILRNALSRNTNLDSGMTMPVVINQTTDQYDLSFNFKDAKSHLTLAYNGSLFRNAEDAMVWEGWQTALNFGLLPTGSVTAYPAGITAKNLNMISGGAPGNDFHQFSLTGGYDFSKTTKLAVNAAYSRNTQNDAMESEELVYTSNRSGSLNGEVITKVLNLKLTAKPVKDLGLTAMYKLNDRDNRTPVNVYVYDDAGEPNAGTKNATWAGVGSGIYAMPANLTIGNINVNANRPFSKKTQDINLEADYNLGKGHALKAGWDYQKIDRQCTGSWIQCSDAPTAKENKLRLEWRAAFNEDLNAKVGYTRSERKADYNEYAWLALVPMAQYVNAAAAAAGVTQSAYQAMLANGFNGWGPLAGFPLTAGVASTTAQQQAALGVNRAYYWLNNNVMAAQTGYGNVNVIYDPLGFRRYYAASRDQDRLRSKLDWQASDRVGLGVGFDYTKDKYPDSTYGLQEEKATNLNLEASFKASDDLSATAFYSYEERHQFNRSNARGANSNAVNVNGLTAITPDGGCTNGAGAVTNTIALRNIDQKINSCGNWSSDRKDKTDTWGLSFKRKNLAGGKLELAGDLMWARSNSDNNVGGGTWANNPYAVTGAPASTVAAIFIPAQPLPTYKTETTTLKLTGNYKLSKISALRLGYSYSHMKVTDWQLSDLQIGGGLTQVLPTNEKAPDFSINTVSAVYIYAFH